jgi:MFS family permease
VALIIGSGITLVSLAGPSTVAFYAGSALTGLGLGSTLGAAMRTLSLLPAHSERGEFFASVYVVGYLAFSVPAIIAGICVVHVGLVKTTVGYGLGISVLALVSAANALWPTRRGASDRAQGQDDRALASVDAGTPEWNGRAASSTHAQTA